MLDAVKARIPEKPWRAILGLASFVVCLFTIVSNIGSSQWPNSYLGGPHHDDSSFDVVISGFRSSLGFWKTIYNIEPLQKLRSRWILYQKGDVLGPRLFVARAAPKARDYALIA